MARASRRSRALPRCPSGGVRTLRPPWRHNSFDAARSCPGAAVKMRGLLCCGHFPTSSPTCFFGFARDSPLEGDGFGTFSTAARKPRISGASAASRVSLAPARLMWESPADCRSRRVPQNGTAPLVEVPATSGPAASCLSNCVRRTARIPPMREPPGCSSQALRRSRWAGGGRRSLADGGCGSQKGNGISRR